MTEDPHRVAEARSLAMHRVIADRLSTKPELVEMALGRVRDWIETGDVSLHYARAWLQLLEGDRQNLVERMTEDNEWGRAMRQCSPFAGALEPRERWRIYDEVRAQLDPS